MRSEQIHIGTSGYHYAHWRGSFYPDPLPMSRWLAFYSRHFDTLEINNSFYRLPTAATFAQWRATVPPNFRFTVKVSRFISHNKNLLDPDLHIPRFLAPLADLGDTLAAAVLQLPPRWRKNPARLEAFLAAWPREVPLAIEFRNPSWHDEEIYALLRATNTAFCLYDLAGSPSPRIITADFTYLRLHGPREAYASGYSAAELAALADWLRAAPGQAAFVFFDNDIGGHAVRDAQALIALLHDGAPGLAAQSI